MTRAWIVTEDYNKLGRYRFTAYSDISAADKHADGLTPSAARRYVEGRHSPEALPVMAERYGPDWAMDFAELHVQVHEVSWPEHDGQPDERATVIGLSQASGFHVQLIVIRHQDHVGMDQFPYFEGYATICPEDEETAGLVLDGPTYEGGDTAL